MRIGVFAKTFSRSSQEGVFDAVAGHGLRETQFNMSVAGLPSMPDEIDPTLADRVREAAADRNIAVVAVSGTFNMIHPDPKVRWDGLRRLGVLAGACERLGISTVTLCTGTRDPEDMWRRHPDNATPEAWLDLLSTMQEALETAEGHGVTLALEPEIGNVVDSAEKGRRLLDEMRSPRLKVVMDAANLFDAEDPARRLSRSEQILDEAFELLGEDIVIVHAKDVRASGEVVAAGKGDLDYGLYLKHLSEAGYGGPLVMHGLAEEEVEGSLAFLRGKLAEVGIGGPGR
ncbi:MAG: sugar phosphate isomerase/epimerase [Actinomycetota bacterium]|nr:sugar phosphate isomerase/epimerase [Rubrobacteraceae bacterium]MBA3637085.1 sugar phosphate isomerase/epimerase [Rubrobacteraceae bacterium]MDQ3183818.1 sugar phosphate isomerase/epimerase [Actinomycetota bacterium]MDQ3496533.1 sugar phosphate isomerase/epimerase [Actinomycetota bacterium]